MKEFHVSEFVSLVERLAPPEGGAEWDNIGLILEAGQNPPLSRVLLTLDLTAEVVEEALEHRVQLIVAYHPPVFGGLKQLNRADPVAAPLLDLLTAGISVYSPHTALDAAPEGMADWLAGRFDGDQIETVEGSGRMLVLARAQSPENLGRHLIEVLGLPYVRQALAPRGKPAIKRLALCPGAGASILAGLEVDAVVTGEMKHHDILAFTRRGVHVYISEHTHTERPYLSVFRERLLSRLPEGVEVLVSEADREPLVLVAPHA